MSQEDNLEDLFFKESLIIGCCFLIGILTFAAFKNPVVAINIIKSSADSMLHKDPDF